jgi:hypothetical protein
MALTPMSGGPAFAPKMPLRRQWLGRGQTGGINPRLDMEQMGAQDAEPLTYQGEPVDPRRMLSKPMPGGAPMSSLLDAYKQASGGGNTIGLPLMPPVGSGGGMQVKPMPGMGVSAPAPAPGGTTFQSSGLGADELEEIKAKYAQQTGQQPPAGSDPPVMEPGAQFTGSKQPPQVMPGQPVKPPVEVDNIPPMIASAIAKGDPGTSIKEAMGATDDLKFDASKPMPTRYPSQMGVGVNHSMQFDPSKPMQGPGRYGGPQAPPMGGDAVMTDMGPGNMPGRMGRGRGDWLGGGGKGQAWPDIMGGGGNPAYLGGLRGLLGGIGGNAPGGFDPNKPITPYGGYGDPTGRDAYLARGGRTGWEPRGGPGGMRAMPMPGRIGPVAQPNKPMMRRPARPKPAGWGRGGGSSGSASSRKIGAP